MNKNNKKKNFTGLFISITLVLVLLLSGCSGSSKEGKVLAVVNGTEITQAQFDREYNQIASQYDFDLKNKDHLAYQADLKDQLLKSLIDEAILIEEATKQGMSVSEEEVKEAVEMASSNFSSQEEFKNYLQQYMGITEEEFASGIQDNMLINKLFAEITKDINSSTMSPKDYYDNNQDVFVQEEEASATHILVKTEEEALKIIEELKAGADMNELAGEKSIDPTAKDNLGELGYFGRGRMVPEFDKAVFEMEKGAISTVPVKTTYGYHVIRLNDKIEKENTPFNEVEEEIKMYLIDEEKQIAFKDYITELREASTIEMK